MAASARPGTAWLWPLLVGAASLAITAWLWRHECQNQTAKLRAGFDFGVRQTATRIEERMASYDQLLRGVRGLLEAPGDIDAQRFERFVELLLNEPHYAGLRSVAFAPLRRSAAGEESAPVVYVAPASTAARDWLGDDAFAGEARRAAMRRAADSGGVALSEAVRADAAEGVPSAYLMFMPVYAPASGTEGLAPRRARLAGWVFASFRVSDLMSSLYGEATPGLEVQVYDGEARREKSPRLREINEAPPIFLRRKQIPMVRTIVCARRRFGRAVSYSTISSSASGVAAAAIARRVARRASMSASTAAKRSSAAAGAVAPLASAALISRSGRAWRSSAAVMR